MKLSKNYKMPKHLKAMLTLMRVPRDQRRLLAEVDSTYETKRRSVSRKELEDSTSK